MTIITPFICMHYACVASAFFFFFFLQEDSSKVWMSEFAIASGVFILERRVYCAYQSSLCVRKTPMHCQRDSSFLSDMFAIK